MLSILSQPVSATHTLMVCSVTRSEQDILSSPTKRLVMSDMSTIVINSGSVDEHCH